MNRLLIVLTAIISASAVSAETDPASALCDRGGGISLADRSITAVRFHQAIQRNITPLKDSHAGCVEFHYEEIRPAVDAYCSARSEIKHDLAVDELRDLNTELMSLYFECGREETDRFIELMERIKPAECSDLLSSLSAMIEYFRSKDDISENYTNCMERNHQSVAGPVVEMCRGGNITLEAALVELNNRIDSACSEHSPWK